MQNVTGEDGSGRGLVMVGGEGVYAGQLPAAGHGPDKLMGRYDISAPCHYGKAVGRPGYCRETARMSRREECMRACDYDAYPARPNYSTVSRERRPKSTTGGRLETTMLAWRYGRSVAYEIRPKSSSQT